MKNTSIKLIKDIIIYAKEHVSFCISIPYTPFTVNYSLSSSTLVFFYV